MIRRFSLITFAALLLSCFGVASANDIGNVTVQLNQTEECDPVSAEIFPTCLINRKRPNNSQEMIEGDSKVCGCLDSQRGILTLTSSTSQINSEEQKRQKLLVLEAQKSGNLSYLQAAQYAKDKKSLEIMAMVYSGQETRSDIKNENPNSTTPIPNMSDAISTINQIDSQNAEWQCVTYQEYSVQREIPSENKFFKLLKDTKSFVPDEWNPDKLERKINSAKGEEQELIILKLSFLNRNPIFNAIMKAVPSDKIPKDKLFQKQKDLFKIFENLRPEESSTCHTVPNKCWTEIHESGAFTRYANAAASFVLDNDVIDITSAQASQDYQASVTRINADENLDSPTDPEAYFNSLQTSDNTIANSCYGSESKAECYLLFKNHCTQLSRIRTRLKKQSQRSTNDVTEILRNESSIHALLNPSENPAFREFNDKICLQAFTNASGESSNFFQFKQKHCSGTEQKPECSDRKKLLDQFLAEYNGGEDASALNLRSGFRGVLGNSEYLELSKMQIAVANNISESPRALRERFGGLFPSISPTGQLIPASNLAGNSGNSGTPSTSIPDPSDDSPSRSSFSAAASAGGAVANTGSVKGNPSSAFANSVSGASTIPQVPGSTFSSRDETETRREIFDPRSNRQEENVSDEDRETTSTATNTQVSSPLPNTNSPVVVQPSPRLSAGSVVVPSLGPATAPRGTAELESASPTFARLSKKNVTRSTSDGVTNNALLSKYGIDQQVRVNSDVSIIPVSSSSEIRLELSSNNLGLLRANPSSLELNDEALAKINENPDEEVMIVVESSNGKETVVMYAKKENSGGVSLSMTPKTSGRSPASQQQKLRINVTTNAYDEISKNGDKYFNKNDVLLLELDTKDTFPVILQVVSPGKKSISYEVNKVNDMRFSFKQR